MLKCKCKDKVNQIVFLVYFIFYAYSFVYIYLITTFQYVIINFKHFVLDINLSPTLCYVDFMSIDNITSLINSLILITYLLVSFIPIFIFGVAEGVSILKGEYILISCKLKNIIRQTQNNNYMIYL